MAHPVPQSARSRGIRGKRRLLSVQNHTSVFSLMCCQDVSYFRHSLYVKVIREIIHPHQTGATLSHCVQRARSRSGRSSHLWGSYTFNRASFYRLRSASIIYCLWSLPRSLFGLPPLWCPSPPTSNLHPPITKSLSSRGWDRLRNSLQPTASGLTAGLSTQSLCTSFASSRYLALLR